LKAVYADENVRLSHKMMAQLYDVEVPTINYHLKKVFEDSELEEDSVIRNFQITAADGKTYDTKHYNLSAIIAVGYKVKSERAVQFRKWATRVVEPGSDAARAAFEAAELALAKELVAQELQRRVRKQAKAGQADATDDDAQGDLDLADRDAEEADADAGEELSA
jgi:hypothetical protein